MRALDAVGRRRVKIVDAETDEVLGEGMLSYFAYALSGAHMNESEARVALDIPEDVMKGGRRAEA